MWLNEDGFSALMEHTPSFRYKNSTKLKSIGQYFSFTPKQEIVLAQRKYELHCYVFIYFYRRIVDGT